MKFIIRIEPCWILDLCFVSFGFFVVNSEYEGGI